MRAQPSISPLTLGICCAIIAGALALAPGRGPFPDGGMRGADVIALEASDGSGDSLSTATNPGRPDEVAGDAAAAASTAEVPSPSAREPGTTSPCAGDCEEAPRILSVGVTATDVAGDGSAGEDRAGGDEATGADGNTDASGDGVIEDHSCRSPRAEDASSRGHGAAAAPSPCSRGRGHDRCRGSECTGERSSGTAQA